ncbi:MAG: hypothetical protein AAF939_03215 [Planctomycetota bacterium]
MARRKIVGDGNSPLTRYIRLLHGGGDWLAVLLKRDAEAIKLLSEPSLLVALQRIDALHWHKFLSEKKNFPPRSCPRIWTSLDVKALVRALNLSRSEEFSVHGIERRTARFLKRIRKGSGQSENDYLFRLALNEARKDGTAKSLSPKLESANTQFEHLIESAQRLDEIVGGSESLWKAYRAEERSFYALKNDLGSIICELMTWTKENSVKDWYSAKNNDSEPIPDSIQSSAAEEEELRILEAKTPQLDTESANWISARNENVEKLGIKISSLNVNRSPSKGGRSIPSKMFGIDARGRIWRREGTPESMVYYYKPSLPAH